MRGFQVKDIMTSEIVMITPWTVGESGRRAFAQSRHLGLTSGIAPTAESRRGVELPYRNHHNQKASLGLVLVWSMHKEPQYAAVLGVGCRGLCRLVYKG